MRLVSVNVSMPKTVEHLGRKVSTGIFKKPVDGRVMVRRLNVDGDGQADLTVHGGVYKAVYAYALENIGYWRQVLDREDIGYGHFGENFTVEGMLDDQIHIGDIFRVGGAMLQVTQPRVPCFKLEIKMDLPGFSRQFLTSGRLGFCFLVLEEGEVGAGDTFELVESNPEKISVWDFARLYFFDYNNHAKIRRLIRIPSVPPDWVSAFKEILDSDGEKGKRRKPQQRAWKGFRPFIVDKKVPESQTITSFYLVPEDGQPLPVYMPGQFLTFRLPIPDRPKPVIRTYSLSECPCHAEYYRVTIKREPSSQGSDVISGSNYFHDSVEPGNRLQVAAPRGDFFLDPQDETPVVLLSGGVGLTPMISMLNAIAASEVKRPAWFVHGTRNGIHHAMCKHMRQVAAENDNISLHIRYSQPRPEDIEGREYDSIGHVDLDLLKSLLPGKDMDFYLCGPPPFMNGLLKALWNWGIPESRIRFELFGPAALLQEGTSARRRKKEIAAEEKAYAIRFSESGITAQWDPEYENLLEFAEDHGVFPEFSCRSGICHSCQYKILKGEAGYSFEPLDPPDSGQVLLCCARPRSDMEIDA